MARKHRKAAGIIASIEIEGFKSIANATLDLGLLNVFVGANGSGKSALFEAIAVLASAADGRIDNVELARRGARLSPIGRYATHLSAAKARTTIALGALGRERGVYRASVRSPDESKGTEWHFRGETIGDAEGTVLHRLARGGFFVDASGAQRDLPALAAARGFARMMPLGARSSAAFDGVVARLKSFRIFEPSTPTLRGIVSETIGNEALCTTRAKARSTYSLPWSSPATSPRPGLRRSSTSIACCTLGSRALSFAPWPSA